LIFTVVLGCLASCGFSGGSEEPNGEIYRADVSITYATSDPAMKEAVAAMKGVEAKLFVNGSNIQVESKTELSSGSVEESYICVDNVVYHSQQISVGELEYAVKNSAFLDEMDRADLQSHIGYGMNISIDDFSNVTPEIFGDNSYYTCSGILDESKDSLTKIFNSALSSDQSCVIKNVEYMVSMQGDLVTESLLSCSFIVTVGENEYEITMHIDRVFTYLTELEIVAPTDVENYKNVHCTEMFR
jgi:hypothetical protein